ncbi:MAG: hypothetical protein P8Z80_12665 [Pseudolabrys sp.]
MGGNDITIVKLGGSLAGSARLAAWVEALAACGGRAVVVPGGGPFADAVRAAQPAMGFGDETAHELALLTMEQYGRAVASLSPGFVVADSLDSMRQALRAGAVPVWSPAAMVLAAVDVPASWDVTSDSLAAWLAGRIGAARLLLVKHGAFSSAPVSAADLVAQGVVDATFPRYLAGGGVPAFVVTADDASAVAMAVGQGRAIGAPIVPAQARAAWLETL